MFALYIPQTSDDKVISFLSTVNTEITTSDIRDTPKQPNTEFIDNESRLLYVSGEITFRNDAEAVDMFNKLSILMTTDRASIESGELRLLDNTHHYPNPLSDKVISINIQGNERNLDKYQIYH